MEDAPEMLTEELVFRRFGYDAAFFDLAEIVSAMENVRTFITDILEYLIDQDAAEKIIADHSLDTEREFFPFTPRRSTDLRSSSSRKTLRTRSQARSLRGCPDAVVAAWRKSRREGSFAARRRLDYRVGTLPKDQA